MTLINIGMDITPDKTLLYVDPVKTSVYRRTVHKAWLLRMKKANGPLKLTMSSRADMYDIIYKCNVDEIYVWQLIYGRNSVLK